MTVIYTFKDHKSNQGILEDLNIQSVSLTLFNHKKLSTCHIQFKLIFNHLPSKSQT